ncbi:MAG: amidohydrolase [Candidatus Limnocylindrales bacterium]
MPAMTEFADVILFGGRIRTMDRSRSIVPAVAVAGGRVIELGADRAVLDRRGPRTRVVDLRGRSVVPGFTDAHVHPVSAGLRHIECNLDRFSTESQILDAIVAYARANPERPWIAGDGWSMETFPGGIARRETLDRIVPDRPVILYTRDGHGAWVNSRALELAGITSATPDPPNGRIERDPDGTPVGMLQESATDLVGDLVPRHTAAELESAILAAQSELHAMGITGWQDASVDPAELDAYRVVARRGALTARVVAALRIDDVEAFGGIDGLVDARGAVAADARAAGDHDGPGPRRLAASSIKFWVDGVVENRTAALLTPYLDPDGSPTTETGFSNREPAELNRLSIELDARGFQLHYHAIGDRAVRESLDAIEATRRVNGSRDARHHIAHIQLIHPDDIPRFAILDAVANAQPLWAVHETQMDQLTIPLLGSERAGWQYPFKSLLRAGARMAFGSDWTVSTAEPFPQLEVAVRRVWPERRDAEPFFPAERLTLDEAVFAATVGSAFVNRQDDAGWLGVGRLADLVVLDRELDDADAAPLAETRAAATMVGGEFVFEAPSLEVG